MSRPRRAADGFVLLAAVGVPFWIVPEIGPLSVAWCAIGDPGLLVGRPELVETFRVARSAGTGWHRRELVRIAPPGALVIDPFAGSGTTGAACLRLGRRFLGFELHPEIARLARDRLEAEASGSDVRSARAGQTALDFDP